MSGVCRRVPEAVGEEAGGGQSLMDIEEKRQH